MQTRFDARRSRKAATTSIGGHVTLFRTFLRDRRGATAIEYCLIAGFIALSIVVGATAIGTKLNGTYTKVSVGLN